MHFHVILFLGPKFRISWSIKVVCQEMPFFTGLVLPMQMMTGTNRLPKDLNDTFFGPKSSKNVRKRGIFRASKRFLSSRLKSRLLEAWLLGQKQFIEHSYIWTPICKTPICETPIYETPICERNLICGAREKGENLSSF